MIIFFFSFLLFIYFISYYHFRYSDSFEKKNYLFTSIRTDYFLKNSLGYVYQENKNIFPQEISITKVNIFNKSQEIYKKKNPPLIVQSVNKEISFYLVPFWTKEIIVKSKILSNNKEINITQIHYPHFEFGIYSFWLFAVPFMWEFVRKIPLIKIGELKNY